MSEMGFEISQDRVEALGEKLDSVSQNFTEEERSLLLAVFGLAKQSLEPALQAAGDREGFALSRLRGPTPLTKGRGELPSLSDGFKSTFSVGRLGGFPRGPGENVANIAVGGTTVTWDA